MLHKCYIKVTLKKHLSELDVIEYKYIKCYSYILSETFKNIQNVLNFVVHVTFSTYFVDAFVLLPELHFILWIWGFWTLYIAKQKSLPSRFIPLTVDGLLYGNESRLWTQHVRWTMHFLLRYHCWTPQCIWITSYHASVISSPGTFVVQWWNISYIIFYTEHNLYKCLFRQLNISLLIINNNLYD